jgi:hypothetical protein
MNENFAANVDRIVSRLGLDSVVNFVATRVLPQFSASAAMPLGRNGRESLVVECYYSACQICGTCGANWQQCQDYFSWSAQCTWGWPVCQGCNWIHVGSHCSGC